MKARIVLFAAVFTASFVTGLWLLTAAAAGPPNSLCTQYNVGQQIMWDHKVWRCKAYTDWSWGYPRTHYYWLDLGYPVY